MRLATTAALEHFTALLGRNALSSDFLNFAHPTMAALMKWHAAEEIEHKSVAFDVFEAVDGRYSVRIAGLFVATLVLMWFWRAGTLHLLRQEEKLGTDLRASWEFAKNNPRLRLERKRRLRLFVRGFLEYMHPSFHPDNTNDAPLAENYLASIGRLDG
ncbi:MAG: metal-dependent hydrolase [Deltaproteobacteria bacterium]|nr:metal-dependent hydrolase [Deltaproteobacteria bacterium]